MGSKGYANLALRPEKPATRDFRNLQTENGANEMPTPTFIYTLGRQLVKKVLLYIFYKFPMLGSCSTAQQPGKLSENKTFSTSCRPRLYM